jgi:hypothetical protein
MDPAAGAQLSTRADMLHLDEPSALGSIVQESAE